MKNYTDTAEGFLREDPSVEQNFDTDPHAQYYEEMDELFDNLPRYTQIMANRYQYLVDSTDMLDNEDLQQHVLIAIYEAWIDKQKNNPTYGRYVDRVAEYHSIDPIDQESTIFKGYIKKKIAWEMMELKAQALGYGESPDNEEYYGHLKTHNESSLRREDIDDDPEDLLAIMEHHVWGGNLHEGTTPMDSQTLINFEKHFGIDTTGLEPSSASKLREILYTVVEEAIEQHNLQLSKQGSGNYLKAEPGAVATRKAALRLIIENTPITSTAQNK